MKYVVKIFTIFVVSLFGINVYASNIEISNIEVSSKTDYVEEISNPSIDGTNIDFNIRFKDEEQKIVYKMDIKNNTSSDLVLDSTFDNNIIKYKLLEFDDNTVKAKSTRTIYLELYYEDEIDESLYNNKLYTASSTFKFSLTGSLTGIKGVFENPKTGVFSCSILVISIVVILSLVFLRTKNIDRFKYHVLAFILLVPIVVFADSLLNETVNGNTSMEFIEPNRAIFDIGTEVNKNMRELTGETQTCTTYGETTTCRFSTTNTIKHIVKADTLQSGAREVQSDNSDYKIYMWFDNESKTIYYYTDADFIYYNENSKSFYDNLSNLIDLELFHTKYLRDASYMFSSVGASISSGANIYINMKTKNVTNMNHMFYWFHGNITEEHDNSFELGPLFTAENAEDINDMFNHMFAGDYRNEAHGSLSIKINDNFNASKAEHASRVFAFAARYIDDIDIDLGNNFNASNAKDIQDFFNESFTYGVNININLGDNFNCKSATDLYAFFYSTASKATGNINIDCGKNFNAESANRLYHFLYNIGNSSETTNSDFTINLGDNFNAKRIGIPGEYNNYSVRLIDSCANHTTGNVKIDFGKNFNAEETQELEYLVCFSFDYASNIDINLGDNFNGKSLNKVNDFIYGIGSNSEGIININFGKNFNGESLNEVRYLVCDIGKYQANGTKEINVDLGDNFGGNSVTYFLDTFRNIKAIRDDQYGDVNINLRDAFGTHSVTYIYEIFAEVYGTNSTNIDFGNLSFEQPHFECCSGAINNLASNSRSVSFTNFPNKVVLPSNYYATNIFNGLAYNSTLNSDLTIDFSENGFNSTSYDYSSEYSVIVSNINPSIKFKTGNKMVGNTGKTLNEFILKNNSNLTNNNFVN